MCIMFMGKKTHIINMSVSPNLIYRVIATVIKIPTGIFMTLEKLIFTYTIYGKVKNRHDTLEKKNKAVKNCLL